MKKLIIALIALVLLGGLVALLWTTIVPLIKDEIENARATIPLVEFDSRLGFEPSMEYMCDREHLELKIEQCERVVADELPRYFV